MKLPKWAKARAKLFGRQVPVVVLVVAAGVLCGLACCVLVVALPTPEATATPIPTATATDTPIPPTDTPTATPTNTRTSTPKPPTATPTETLTPIPPTYTPTRAPTATPAPPTNTPTPGPAKVTIVAVNKRDEHVDIQNVGGLAQDLAGWVLLSVRGEQACPLGGMIGPGATLRIYARSKDADKGGYNCGFGKNIWNNSESDPAVLYNAQGEEVSRK